jgi:hypothetical protein
MRQELTQLGGGAHALATQILGNADDAADAVHDAFETVLKRPQAYDSSIVTSETIANKRIVTTRFTTLVLMGGAAELLATGTAVIVEDA